MKQTKSKKLPSQLKDGTKVKLNLSRIRDHPDFQNLVWEYRQFVKDNEDTVFEVVNDTKFSLDKSLVLLQKDGVTFKWLLYTDNLKRVKGE